MNRILRILAFASGLSALSGQSQTVPSGFQSSLVMDGWYSPVGATWDANGRMYVWEKSGRVWIVENGVKLATPLLNLLEEVGNWGDHGMLGFALDPNYLTNGRIYVMYVVDRHHLLYYGTPDYNPATTDGGTATIVRIVRYTATGPNFNVADPASRTVRAPCSSPATAPCWPASEMAPARQAPMWAVQVRATTRRRWPMVSFVRKRTWAHSARSW